MENYNELFEQYNVDLAFDEGFDLEKPKSAWRTLFQKTEEQTMRTAFYCRIGSQVFACVLPDERHKLRAFLDSKQKPKQRKALRKIAISNLKKGNSSAHDQSLC